MFSQFLPSRISSFLDGFNVNIMAYGQTGSGKTHTMFGPPGIMSRAASGEYGFGITPEYGIFPRALIEIYHELKVSSTPHVLVASIVELSIAGTVDMLAGERLGDGGKLYISQHEQKITVDMSAEPPKAIGQSCIVIDNERDILTVFNAIASRSTSVTSMNNSSSRSHCFAWLTLFRKGEDDDLRVSRFQFVDLAGSERLKDAHNGQTNVRSSNADANLLAGFANNYSLMMLSTCVRDLVHARKTRNGNFSFRKYIGYLVPLLSESLTGEALTLVVVCISQAPSNTMQGKFALDFGSTFAKLSVRARKKKSTSLRELERHARSKRGAAEAALDRAHGQSKTKLLRQAQIIDAKNLIMVLARLRGEKSVRPEL